MINSVLGDIEMDFSRLASLAFVVFLVISNAYAKAAPHAIVCDQAYALCTSAQCVPHPNDANKSICDCAVQQGKSAGFTSCAKRKPYVDQYRATHLISTFSFEQFAEKKSLTCPKGNAWSNCVDMSCTVDPQNPKHAICVCKLSAAQAFFTFGGNCANGTCSTGFWSGATRGPESDALRDALNKGIANPVTPAVCPVKAIN